MSLYGIDIIIDDEDKYKILEINGIASGMKGFEQIYGDKRVEDKVYSMLQEKYGKLTVNDCKASELRFKKEHPIRHKIASTLLKIPSYKKWVENWVEKWVESNNKILHSEDSEYEWIKEETKSFEYKELPFEKYVGQNSTVINLTNEYIAHNSVNRLIDQEFTENKFFQYILLKDTEIKDNIIESSLVGLSLTVKEDIEKMCAENEQLVVKPVRGSRGMGVKFLTRDEILAKYVNNSKSEPSLKELSNQILDQYLGYKFSKVLSGKTPVEELIKQNNYLFEYGISIVQPFVNSARSIGEEPHYSSIRAIVCNGKFVDAYMRISVNPKVNLSQDANPILFNSDNKFVELCENIVKTLERESWNYSWDTFKKSIYTKHINRIRDTSNVKYSEMYKYFLP